MDNSRTPFLHRLQGFPDHRWLNAPPTDPTPDFAIRLNNGFISWLARNRRLIFDHNCHREGTIRGSELARFAQEFVKHWFTGSSSRPQVLLKGKQALQIMRGRKHIDEREGRSDPACHRLVIVKAEQRIEPNELGDATPNFFHLSC
jgi:hypothetical protein